MVHSARALRERRRLFDSDKCGHSDEHFHFALAVDSYRARFCFTVCRPSRISRRTAIFLLLPRVRISSLPEEIAPPGYRLARKCGKKNSGTSWLPRTTNVKLGFLSAALQDEALNMPAVDSSHALNARLLASTRDCELLPRKELHEILSAISRPAI